jgi:predicted GH43/DUF377 family glycosyl hydrolase
MQKEILVRHKENPILLPNESNWWESKAVFNCGTLYDGTRIHMLYRAIGEYERYISRIGYASSTDGYCFDKREEIALEPKEEYERYGINQRSSNENETEGSTKYLFLHRPSSWVGSVYGVDRPSIWIGEGSSLTNFEKHTLLIKPDQRWEMLKVGAGPPPVKTKHGWLLIYHGVNESHVYRAGAALLDLNDPSKVLGRTKRPILEPKEPYEKYGDVNNVVFPTGACIMDGKLLVYYGAADKVCCLATAELENLIDYVLKDYR